MRCGRWRRQRRVVVVALAVAVNQADLVAPADAVLAGAQLGQQRLDGGAGTEAKEFALELFDTLSRRRQMQVDKINKEELREIWQQITDNSFDSRLQIFFDM